MQTYYLNSLLLFLKSQQSLGYEAFNIIIGIMEDATLPDEDKRDSILFILHKYGLNEVTYKDGRHDPEDKPAEEMKELEPSIYHKCYIAQKVILKLLNGTFPFEVGLN